MGIENFLNYEHFINLQNKQLQIWGQNCTIFVPENITNLGYENVTRSETDKMNADSILSNKYKKQNGRIWINFKVEKKVFYKFNYFPEEGEELVMAFMDSSVQIRENAYIRTSVPGTTSIWGDLIFEVIHIQDIGLAQVLQRVYFLKATNNQELYRTLSVGNMGEITGAPNQSAEILKPIIIPTGEGGTTDYSKLENKPSINDVIIEGNKTTKDLKIETEDKYNDDKGSGVSIGGITEGEKFEDKPIADVVYQMLHPYKEPVLDVRVIPNQFIWGIGEEINSIKFNVSCIKGSENLNQCKIFVNDVEKYIRKIHEDCVVFTYELDDSINNETTIKIVLDDAKTEVEKIYKYEFVNYSYFGVLSDEVEINVDSILSLNKFVKTDSDYVSEPVTCEYGRIIYAYPSHLGEIKSIKDLDNSFNWTDSFELNYININGVDYNVYYLRDSSGFVDAKLIFKS